MTGYTLLGIIMIVILIAIAGTAIWLTCVLISEAQVIKQAVKDTQKAFGNIEIEINKKLLVHNALHYSDLLGIIKRVGDMVPGVDIEIKREFDSNRLHICVESDGIKMKYTFLATIVEYGIPRLNETA
jgi:hypothetical protein